MTNKHGVPRRRRTPRRLGAVIFLATSLFVLGTVSARADDKTVLLATTTSVYDTGLLDTLTPFFERQSGLSLKTIAVGTGRALRMGRDREMDVLLVHAPDAEQRFMAEGHGRTRRAIMHNFFAIVGPSNDPAGVRGADSPDDALRRIAAAKASFVSRGDNSGTHMKERTLWSRAGVSYSGAPGYREAGQGMAATLRLASELGAYTLTDKGTFLSLKTTIDLVPHYESGEGLRNPYSVITIVPAGARVVNTAGADAFVRFLVRPGTQWLIGKIGREKFGESLFTPDVVRVR